MAKKSPKAPAKSKTTIRLPDDLIQRAKHRAIDERCDFQDVVQRALEQYLGGK